MFGVPEKPVVMVQGLNPSELPASSASQASALALFFSSKQLKFNGVA